MAYPRVETMADKAVEFPLPQTRDHDLILPDLLTEISFIARLNRLFLESIDKHFPLSVLIMSGLGPAEIDDPEVTKMGETFVDTTKSVSGLRGRLENNMFGLALMDNNVSKVVNLGFRLIDHVPQAFVGVNIFDGESDSFSAFLQQSYQALSESRIDFDHKVAILANSSQPVDIMKFSAKRRDRVILKYK